MERPFVPMIASNGGELSVEFVEVLRPVRQAAGAKPFDSPTVAVLRDHPPRGQNVILRARADKGERRRTERELEEAPSERRDVIVVRASGWHRRQCRSADRTIRTAGTSHGSRHFSPRHSADRAWSDRIDNHVTMGRIGDLGQALRRQHDSGVLLAQGAEPFLDLRARRRCW